MLSSPHRQLFTRADHVSLVIRQGVQGMYGAASGASLHSEFDTEDVDEVIKKILQSGSVQTMEVSKPPSVPLSTCTIREALLTLSPTRCPADKASRTTP